MATGRPASITSHTSISPRKRVTINLSCARSDHITYIDSVHFFRGRRWFVALAGHRRFSGRRGVGASSKAGAKKNKFDWFVLFLNPNIKKSAFRIKDCVNIRWFYDNNSSIQSVSWYWGRSVPHDTKQNRAVLTLLGGLQLFSKVIKQYGLVRINTNNHKY